MSAVDKPDATPPSLAEVTKAAAETLTALGTLLIAVGRGATTAAEAFAELRSYETGEGQQ